MIKASELRIGNTIWDDTRNKIKWVNHRVISDLASSAEPLPYSPIALNPDWLRKCGFGYIASENVSYYIRIGLNLLLEFDQNLVCRLALETPMYKTIIPSSAEIKYLHQLQNIYFDHTGKELEIKL